MRLKKDLQRTNPDGLVTTCVLEELKHSDVDVLLSIVLDNLACGGVAITCSGIMSSTFDAGGIWQHLYIPGMSGATTRNPMAENASIWGFHSFPIPGQPWTKIKSGPLAGPAAW